MPCGFIYALTSVLITYMLVFWSLFFPTQELQKALDKRKAIVLSVNLCSGEFVQWDSEESREMQARLTDMNNHWDKLGRALEGWRASLQDALMQCQVGVLSAAKEPSNRNRGRDVSTNR